MKNNRPAWMSTSCGDTQKKYHKWSQKPIKFSAVVHLWTYIFFLCIVVVVGEG